MLRIVKTISSKLSSGVRFVKFLKFGKSDVQEKRQAAPFGDDSDPVAGMSAIYAKTTKDGEEVIIGYINKNQISGPGEKRIFSTDSDNNPVFALYLRNNGTAEFGGDSDNMVRFSPLETDFNQLKSDFNSFVTAYNSHTHITTATVGASPVPGIISPTLSTATPSSADISGAKIDEIKTL